MSPPISTVVIHSSHLPKPPPPPSLPTTTTTARRRAAVILSTTFLTTTLLPSFHHPPTSSAISFGIPGPKEWLREQKKKASRFLLAPIDASRNTLQSAYLLLTNRNAENSDKEFEQFQLLLKSAARDCVPKERNSFVTFQSNTGVEVCTFRLVLKNASSLLDDKDPVKLEAEAQLSDLVRSFSSLSGLASDTGIQLESDRQKVADALMDTLSSLNKFEQGVKDCLEI